MGRYNFSAQNVHKQATLLLDAKRIPAPPPWYQTIGTTPPSTRLSRPALQRPQKPGKKASKLFKPLSLQYTEDQLRWEYYNDHPWELARPRVILEDDGRDRERWDWSIPLDYNLRRPRAGDTDELGNTWRDWDRIMQKQSARPINGESVIQRWHYLLTHTPLTSNAAYDLARKELYRNRHHKEIQARVAKEEAQAVGAYFGLGPVEVGDLLEDRAYENWKLWAIKETQAIQAVRGSMYSGNEEAEVEVQDLEAVSESVPGSQGGQAARGGAVARP